MVGSIVCLGLVALIAAYMTGFISIGDPFPGTWDSGDGKIVIRHTDEGYSYSLVYGRHSSGWSSARRTRNTLTSVRLGRLVRVTLVFQPWSRHLLVREYSSGGTAVLHKVSGDTTIPPTAPATNYPDSQF